MPIKFLGFYIIFKRGHFNPNASLLVDFKGDEKWRIREVKSGQIIYRLPISTLFSKRDTHDKARLIYFSRKYEDKSG